MLRFGETKVAKEKVYSMVQINPLNFWNVKLGNTVISKLVETKTNSKYLTGYLDKVIRPLILILPKMSRYIKAFTVKDEYKDKSSKLMSFRIDDEKLLEKY